MVIRTKEEFEKVKEQINPDLLANPGFESVIYWEFFYQLSNGKNVTINIDESGKFIRISQQMEVNRNDRIPNSTISVIDVKLNERGQMNVIKSFGTLYDANVYYREIPKQRPSYNATSVLFSNYSNFIYDSNGIELSYSNYSNGPWNLTGYETRFDNEVSFKTQLLSDGFHKPSEWYTNGPKIPTYCDNATVRGINRTGTMGVAEVYSYDVTANGWSKNQIRQLGQIHGENPDRLRVDNYEIFAEYDASKGKYVVTPMYANIHPDKTVEEISEEISEKQPEILERSNLCRYMRGDSRLEQKYAALVEMIEKNNSTGKNR